MQCIENTEVKFFCIDTVVVMYHTGVIHGRVEQPLGVVRQPIQTQSTAQNFTYPVQETQQQGNLPTSG